MKRMTAIKDTRSVLSASHWGLFYADIDKHTNSIVGIRPWEHDAHPSPNLGVLKDWPTSDVRIRHCYIRKGFLEAGSLTKHRRGDDTYVKVPWDVALQRWAREVNRTYDTTGPMSVWGSSYGWKSPGVVHNSRELLHRLLNLRGGFIQTENNYSEAAISRMLRYAVGGTPRTSAWDGVYEHADLIVLWGANPVVTNDIDWTTPTHAGQAAWAKLKALKKTIIVIDPVYHESAQYLGAQWIAPHPGTDVALMSALLYVLIDENLADEAFCEAYTSGWDTLKADLLGMSDGIPKTPAWAETITGVDANTIRDLARRMSAGRTQLMMGWGMQRAHHGEMAPWMGLALACALGHVGLPGGGIGFSYQYASAGTPTYRAPWPRGLPYKVDAQKPFAGSMDRRVTLPVARFADCFLHPGKTILFDGKAVTYPKVELVVWAGGNPFAHHPDTNRVREAFRQPSTVVVIDNVWSATARHADIVFPATTTLERQDWSLIGSGTKTGYVFMGKAIDPVGESLPEYDLFVRLARALDLEKPFTEDKTAVDWMRATYEASIKASDMTGLPSWEDFQNQGVLLFPETEDAHTFVDFAAFRADPKQNRLATESGLIQLRSPHVESLMDPHCPGLPRFVPPQEGVGTGGDAFPLALMAIKSPQRLHSQLDLLTKSTEQEPCWIHPEDAASRDIHSGEVVLVRSPRGQVLAYAWVTPHTKPGVIVMRHGAWYDPQETEVGLVDVRGNVNTLTLDIPTSSLSQGNVASSPHVNVEKWTREVPSLRVDRPPVED